MIAAGVSDTVELFQSDTVHDNSQSSLMQPWLPGLEAKLQVKHATAITQFKEELNDDPEYACCCCCERLQQRKALTSMKNSGPKFSSPMWQKLK